MVNEKKIDVIKSSGPFKLLDILIFGAVTALVVVLLIFSYSGPADKVTVTYNNITTAYSIYTDNEIDIDGLLTVVIKEQKVFVKDSHCPDKVCEHTGAISRKNQSIICAPYGIIVRITGGQDRWAV